MNHLQDRPATGETKSVWIVCKGCGSPHEVAAAEAAHEFQCRCGFVINEESEPAAPPDSVPPQPQPKRTATHDVCPSCGVEVAGRLLICVECGYDRLSEIDPHSHAAEEFTRADERQQFQAEVEAEQRREFDLRHRVIPLWILAIGALITLGAAPFRYRSMSGPEAILTTIELAIGSVALLCAMCWIAAMVLDVGFGAARTVVVKVAGIYLMGQALIGASIAVLGLLPMMLFLPVILPLYIGMLVWFFEFDMREAAITTCLFLSAQAIGWYVLKMAAMVA